jgi:hypothetical protein
MKNLKNIVKMFIVLGVFFTLASCKKDKDEKAGDTAGTFDYQNQNNTINSGIIELEMEMVHGFIS